MSPPRFDPVAARDRLARARGRAEEAASPAAVQRLLEARARDLARPPPAAGVAAAVEAFELRTAAGERLGIEGAICREVVREARPVELPGGLPPWFRGVLLHRGELLPAVDLVPLLQGGAGGGSPGRALIVGRARSELVLLAAGVGELLRLGADELRSPPPGADPLVRALGPGALVILDGAALLADPRLFHDASRGVAWP